MLTLSPLPHTWLLDLDGTILKHNGYKQNGHDTLLDGALEFLQSIPKDDMLVFITSRTPDFKDITEAFLAEHGIHYNQIIYNAPFGERILVNDRKPSGLSTAHAINIDRDVFKGIQFRLDGSL
jgi:hypothetical protein